MFGYYGYGQGRRLLKANPETAQPKKTEIPYSRFTRVPVEVKNEISGLVSPGRAFLFDFRPTSLAFFTTDAVERGSKLSIVLEHPQKVFVRGEVVWCTLTPWNPKIIREENFIYRVYAKFYFESAEEVTAIKNFCQSL